MEKLPGSMVYGNKIVPHTPTQIEGVIMESEFKKMLSAP